MNGRILAASILGPLASSIVAGLLMLFGLDRSEVSEEVSLFVYFLPGLTYGALFVVFALLPLLFVLRRIQVASRITLIAAGLGLWVLAVALITAPAWGLSLHVWPGLVIPLLVPGVVLVLVFSFVAAGKGNVGA